MLLTRPYIVRYSPPQSGIRTVSYSLPPEVNLYIARRNTSDPIISVCNDTWIPHIHTFSCFTYVDLTVFQSYTLFMSTINHKDLHRFEVSVLTGIGVPADEAAIIADVLTDADLKGIDSHGISRLKHIYYDRIKEGIVNPATSISIEKESASALLINGNNGMGHVISSKALNLGLDKARQTGSCFISVYNSSHYGIAGYYTDYAADRDIVCITGTNARPSVAPIHGKMGMLGTNPLTIGIPTDEAFNFNIDCATSVSQRGKVELYAREHKSLPDNWVTDDNGQPLTDANEALKMLKQGSAAFVPLGGISEDTGGHKGYGYSIAVEILSAALSNGPYLRMLNGTDENGNLIPYRLGHFFILIDPAHFIDIDIFKTIAGNILRSLRSSPAKEGEHIFTPGEKEYIIRLERMESGISLTENMIKEMQIMKNELDLSGFESIFR